MSEALYTNQRALMSYALEQAINETDAVIASIVKKDPTP